MIVTRWRRYEVTGEAAVERHMEVSLAMVKTGARIDHPFIGPAGLIAFVEEDRADEYERRITE